MFKILASINRAAEISIDLDFGSAEKRTRRIIEALAHQGMHQGVKKYLARLRDAPRRFHWAREGACAPLLAAAVPGLLLWSLMRRPQEQRPVHALYVTAGNALLERYCLRHARMFGISDYRMADQYRTGFYANGSLARYMAGLVLANPGLCFRPYLMLNVWAKLGAYNAMLAVHRPQVVYSFNEMSIAGPFITQYLNSLGLRHEQIMHGYKAFHAKDAFCEYDRMYVFGEYFKNLFQELGCRVGEYVLMGHPSMDDASCFLPPAPGRRVLLVLQNPATMPVEPLPRFHNLLKAIPQAWDLVLRPHPLEDNYAREALPDLAEERRKDNEAIFREYGVFAGFFSTYLLEAWAWGRKVILLGSNTFPKNLISGPTVLRLSLDPRQADDEQLRLERFLRSPAQPDRLQIQRAFSNAHAV